MSEIDIKEFATALATQLGAQFNETIDKILKDNSMLIKEVQRDKEELRKERQQLRNDQIHLPHPRLTKEQREEQQKRVAAMKLKNDTYSSRMYINTSR